MQKKYRYNDDNYNYDCDDDAEDDDLKHYIGTTPTTACELVGTHQTLVRNNYHMAEYKAMGSPHSYLLSNMHHDLRR